MLNESALANDGCHGGPPPPIAAGARAVRLNDLYRGSGAIQPAVPGSPDGWKARAGAARPGPRCDYGYAWLTGRPVHRHASQDREPLMQYFASGYRPGDPRMVASPRVV